MGGHFCFMGVDCGASGVQFSSMGFDWVLNLAVWGSSEVPLELKGAQFCSMGLNRGASWSLKTISGGQFSSKH